MKTWWCRIAATVTWCLGIHATAKIGPGAQVTLVRYHELDNFYNFSGNISIKMKDWHQSYETADGFGDDDDDVVRFPNPLASERHSWQLRNLTNDVAEKEEDDKGAHADAMMMMMMMMRRRRRRRGTTKHMLTMVMKSTCWQARQEVKLTRTSVLPILWQSERPRSGEECQNVGDLVMIVKKLMMAEWQKHPPQWVICTYTYTYMYRYMYCLQ